MKHSHLFLFLLISYQNLSALPVITSFSPSSGPIGTSVTITGTGFSSVPTSNTVFFGATKATVTAASTTQLTVTVPIGATYQYITVNVSNLIAYSSLPFIVTFCSDDTINLNSFAPKIDFTTGFLPNSVVLSDIDGNGKSDIIEVNEFVSNLPTVGVLRNLSSIGNISFASKVDFATFDNAHSCAIGDINLDGKPDLVVVNRNANSVSVFKNTSTIGTISFATKVDFWTENSPQSVCIGDIDLDGKPDLVVANYGADLISVFRNTSTIGTISFAAKVDFTTGQAPKSLTIGDIDLDGKTDLAVVNFASSTVSIFRNTSTTGNISFATKIDFITGSGPISVSIGDLDLNNKADIEIANYSSSTISVLRNTSTIGNISFASKVDFPTSNNPCNISIGDLNGNGIPDLAVANEGSNSISIFKNLSSIGNISFSPKVDFSTGDNPRSIAIGDIDGDGKSDISVVNQNSNSVSVFRNLIPGGLTPSANFNFAPNNQCGNLPIQFTNTSTGFGLNYNWDFGDPASGINNSSTATNPTHTFSSATGNGIQNFNVTLTVTASGGCTDVESHVVTVSQIPSASIADQDIFSAFTNCQSGAGSSFTLTIDNSSTTQATNTNYTINWGDGSTVNYGATLPNGTSHTYNTLGYFTILVSVTGQNSCVATNSYSVFNGGNPSVGLGIPQLSPCICGPVTLSFPVLNTNNNTPGTNYSVSYGDGPPTTYTQANLPDTLVHTYNISSCGFTSPGGFSNSFCVSILATNPCGSASSTVEPIRICIQPTASLSISQNPQCTNVPVTFTNTSIGVFISNGVCINTVTTTWHITGPGATNLTSNSATYSNSFSTPGVYTAELISGNPCGNDTIIQTFTIVGIPTIPNAGTGFSLCSNASSINLNSLNPTPAGGTWSGIGVTGNSFSPATLNGVQIITYTVGAASCLDSDTIHVTVIPIPNVSVNSPSICIGSSSTLTANGATSYSWTPSTGLSATSGSIVMANPTVTSTYIVTGVNSATGCGNSTTSIVTVNPLPIVNAGSDQNFCNANTLIPLIGTPAGGTWSGTGVSGNNFNPGIAGVGNWTLTYNYTDTNGCTNSDQALMTVINPTQANAGNGFSICVNASSVNLNSLNPNPVGGTWSGNGVTGNLFSPTSLNGIQILTYTFGTGTCLTTDTVHITVKPLPTVTVNSPAFCIGSSSTLIANGATTYLWTPSIGLSATIGSSVTSNPVVTTTYTVTGINSATGCGNSATSIVTVNPLPVVNAGSDQNFCNANTLIPLIGTPAGGTWSGTGVTGNNFNPGTAGIGSWTLTYSYTNSNSCSNSDQVLMTVTNPTQANAGTGFNICIDADSINLDLLNPTPIGGTWSGNGVTGNIFSPITLNGLQIVTYSFGSGLCLTTDTIHVTVNSLPIVTVNFSSSICIGDSVTLTAGGADTYLWNPSTGLNNTTGAIVSASPSDTTTYSVIGTTIYGCTSENFSLVTVIDLNNPLSATNAVVCQSGEATISAIPSTNGNTILWYTDSIGGTSIFEGLSYTSFFGTSIIFYASTFNYLTGCESQERLPVLVSVYPLPQIEINFTDATYGNNGAINATVTNGHPSYTFDWSNDGTGDFNDSSFISGLTEGNYSLTVSDQEGCTNNIDVAIVNGEEILIPTGISPNGDGINDTWEIPGSYQYNDIVVSIFNLQGQLLYYQNKNYLPWNGKYQGEFVPVGDYYFVIESLSHKRKQTGTITVKY